MRQGQQQHRRGRNRGNNNNNRKGQNPLTRNFESSGPDVKIRGTPAHVAEKYMSLARDALSAGDPVLAENYLQHAEHYNRIILAYREQQTQNAPEAQHNGSARQRDNRDPNEDASEETPSDDSGEDTARVVQPGDPQPSISAEERGSSPKSERSEGRRQSRSRGGNGAREGREPREGRSQQRDSRRRDRQRFGESDQQPDFLRRPVRRSRGEEAEAPESGDSPAPAAAEAASEQE